MKYFFILGRNPDLSRAEIYSYFESRAIEFKEIVYNGNILLVDLKSEQKLDINEFGGIVMIGKILFSGLKKEVLDFIDQDELIPADKFSFNVIGNYDIEQEVYKKFKKEGKKAMLRHGRGQIKRQDDEIIELPNADFHLFCFKQNSIYFGVVDQTFSAKEIKHRDMNKPVRREQLAISPRLAKILINLSQVKPGERLLDPFCGVGGIMQEAIIFGINSYGIDNDRTAIIDAKKNLDWIKNNYKNSANFELKLLDSKHAPEMNFDGIASESSLGELTKKKLNEREAEAFINNFERRIIPLLKKFKNIKKPDGLIAITFPFIRKYSVNIVRILQETGLRIFSNNTIKFPIREFRKDQFVSREIFVFR